MVSVGAAVPASVAASSGAQPYLSLVVPAYNEERRLGSSLERIVAYLGAMPASTELIVVDDGSLDRTTAFAEAAFARSPVVASGRVRAFVHRYVPNAGKGRAVRAGVALTRGRYVAFSDADLSTPLAEIDRALLLLQHGACRIVAGSRAVAGATVGRRQPRYRQWSARLFNVLRDSIAGVQGLHDTQCGLKVFDGDVARWVFGRQVIDGFMFDVETMVIAQRLGISVYEMGVRWDDVPDSKVRLSSGLRLLPDLVRIRLAHRRVSPSDLRPAMTSATASR
jgi:dolichyl-phosphate beta-glucosyltransferase